MIWTIEIENFLWYNHTNTRAHTQTFADYGHIWKFANNAISTALFILYCNVEMTTLCLWINTNGEYGAALAAAADDDDEYVRRYLTQHSQTLRFGEFVCSLLLFFCFPSNISLFYGDLCQNVSNIGMRQILCSKCLQLGFSFLLENVIHIDKHMKMLRFTLNFAMTNTIATSSSSDRDNGGDRGNKPTVIEALYTAFYLCFLSLCLSLLLWLCVYGIIIFVWYTHTYFQ